MRRIDFYWMENDEWWDVIDGRPVVKPDAPKEAQESYKRYLEDVKKGDGD